MADKAKMIKKLVLQNRWTLEEVAQMADVTVQEAARLYKGYMGEELPPSFMVVGQDEPIDTMMRAIKEGKHVLLIGPPGIGKTTSAMTAIRRSDKIIKKINLSDKRTGQMLAEELYGSHLTKSDNVFLLDEADNFHWQSHAYFEKLLEDSQVSIILTCNNMDGVAKSIQKYLKDNGYVIRMMSPGIADLEKFLEKKFPALIGRASMLYDKDFRVVMRRILYGFSDTNPETKVIKCEQAAGAVYGEKNPKKRLEVIKQLEDPLLWLVPWLDYNSIRFFPDISQCADFMDKVSRIDSWLTRTSEKYTRVMFASLPCPGRRGAVNFPGPLFAAEKQKKEEEEEEEVVTKSTYAAPQPASTTFDPLNF